MVNSVFSLELLALTKIAIHILSDPDIKAILYKNQTLISSMSAKIWEPIIMKKWSSSDLPLLLKKKVIALIQPLSVEIDHWTMDHVFILKHYKNESLNKYVWKDNGTIDRLKTAKKYIQCESNSFFRRFHMACGYWLEEEAKQLWEKMPETSRRRLDAIRVDPLNSQWDHVVKDWIAFLKSGAVDWRKHPFSHPFSWYCLDNVVIQGNLPQHLSPQDQLNVFKTMIKGPGSTHTKTLCLLKMNAEQFKIRMKMEPVKVFKSLCNWPMHLLLQEMSDHIFSFLNERQFLQFLIEVVYYKIGFDWMDCDYVELLNELWKKCPVHFKQYVESSEFFDILKMALNHDYKEPFHNQCPWEYIYDIVSEISFKNKISNE
ncbi:uncharacterized protein NPIL_137221 [Nephila pilipes]|uniref:Uncharacterized protein n=1 Tax=Nephila pilipes TaxID=299642 RepID=A0A8X6MNT0_NEPPI|nr:uncharacterized protein NPIL_137221 [Nephila pilipes]